MVNKIKHIIMEGVAMYGDIALTALYNNTEMESLILGEKNYELADEKGNSRNLILMVNINDDFIKAIQDLLSEKVINFAPTSQMVVIHDGGRIINLPVAKKLINYKSPRWLPVLVKKGENFPQFTRKFGGVDFHN